MRKQLTLLMILAANLVNAQNPVTASMGISRALFGSGDLRGVDYFNELKMPLGDHIGLLPSIHIAYGSNQTYASTEPRFTTAALGLDFFAYYSPMITTKSKVMLFTGASIRHFNVGNPKSFGNTPNPNFGLPNLYYFDYETQKQNTIGYGFGLEGEAVLKKWSFGGRGYFSTYLNGQSIAAFGLKIGREIN